MSKLNPSRQPVFRKMTSRVVVGLLAAVFALWLPGIANLGATEVIDAELAKGIAKTENAIASRPKRPASRTAASAARLGVTTPAGKDHSPQRPDNFHDGHSLPNGLRAPLLC